jgi:hypothetical protein
MPDRDVYYLIGLRHERQGTPVEQFFWADGPENEGDIWRECLSALKEIDKPRIVHYGAYETRFLRHMRERWKPTPQDAAFVDRILEGSVNLLARMYGRIYFPTYSNGLKDIARWLGFEWTWPQASGTAAMLLRRCWELTRDARLRRELIAYNIEDCRAAAVVTKALTHICGNSQSGNAKKLETVNVGSLEVGFQRTFGKFPNVLPEFEKINTAAYWNVSVSRGASCAGVADREAAAVFAVAVQWMTRGWSTRRSSGVLIRGLARFTVRSSRVRSGAGAGASKRSCGY